MCACVARMSCNQQRRPEAHHRCHRHHRHWHKNRRAIFILGFVSDSRARQRLISHSESQCLLMKMYTIINQIMQMMRARRTAPLAYRASFMSMATGNRIDHRQGPCVMMLPVVNQYADGEIRIWQQDFIASIQRFSLAGRSYS